MIFPSREIYFSLSLLHLMRLENTTCPKTLDQWYELCHPSDHEKISRLEQIIYNTHDNFFSLTRKLYCGDGFYRNFRLDALIQRHSDGRPVKLFGNEVLGLSAWLDDADEGDRVECTDDSGRVKVLEAVRVAGVMTLNDITLKEDLERENLTLRHEISRRIFSPSPQPLTLPKNSERSDMLFEVLSSGLDSALNVLTSNTQLKALKRSLGSLSLNVGIVGLSGSGKTALAGALTGERLDVRNTPVFIREGDRECAKVFYQDGSVKELGVRSEELGSVREAARVEVTIPGALIPEGVCVVDTPGADSFEGAGALKNILPELDFVIYVVPTRARLKGTDYKLLDELGGDIVFVLSRMDTERDDSEAGRVMKTSREKIQSNIEAIKRGVKFDAEVIPISAKSAGENFFNRSSEGWKNSNIESITAILNSLGKAAIERALVSRVKKALNILAPSSSWQLEPTISRLKNSLALAQSYEAPVSPSSFLIPNPSFLISNSSLLSSLVTSMREHGFKSRFFSLKAFADTDKAVLLSADRHMSMKLFARLSHNLALEELPDGGASLGEWLCTGEVMPFGCVRLSSSMSEKILIAPPDHMLGAVDWPKLFADYVPVVSVELARLESGLADLIHSPYVTGLALASWVLVCPDGDLVAEGYRSKIKNFAEENGLRVPEFFIYDNYKII